MSVTNVTRINVVPPEMLRTDHLGAEYRELPRVFTMARKKISLGILPSQIRIPPTYRLGEGHVTFFIDKLDYLTDRYLKICQECRNRNRAVNYGNIDTLTEGIHPAYFNYWEPSPIDYAINIDRLIENGGLRPSFEFPYGFFLYHLPLNP